MQRWTGRCVLDRVTQLLDLIPEQIRRSPILVFLGLGTLFDQFQNLCREVLGSLGGSLDFRELQAEYEQEGRGIRIREVDDAFGFVTLAENDMFLRKLCTPVRVRRLSQAALEVLAIIAYRQPVTRSEIDSIRGIKSERVIDGLIDKGLIEISGRSEGVGRPLIYSTTKEFLKKFGFSSLKDLPEVPEYEEMRREREEEGYGQLAIDFEDKE